MESINIHAINWRLNEVKFLIKNRGHFKLQEDLHEWILHNLEYVEKEVKVFSTMKLETTYIDFYKVKREISSIKEIINKHGNGEGIADREVLTSIILNSIHSIESEIKKNWTEIDFKKDFEKGDNQSWFKTKLLKLKLIMKSLRR